MPSFSDSAFIFVIALLLFGPKKLPELARYVGKLMAEFRRASNEFRTQMEDELRVSEQAEQQKKIEALEAAAPVAALPASAAEPEHPHIDPPLAAAEDEPVHHIDSRLSTADAAHPPPAALPIATSGDMNLYPPATGLPQARTVAANGASNEQAPATASSSVTAVFDSIPHVQEPEAPTHG